MATCAMPVMTTGSNKPVMRLRSTKITIAGRIVVVIAASLREQAEQEIDRLDADERHDQPAQAIDEQVVAEQDRRLDRLVLHAAKCERDQGDDDEGVED